MSTIRRHTIHVPGLDALGDFVEAMLRLPGVRKLRRLRRRVAHRKGWTAKDRFAHEQPLDLPSIIAGAVAFAAGLALIFTF